MQILVYRYKHQRRKCEGSSPYSLRPISYFGSIWELHICLRPRNQILLKQQGTLLPWAPLYSMAIQIRAQPPAVYSWETPFIYYDSNSQILSKNYYAFLHCKLSKNLIQIYVLLTKHSSCFKFYSLNFVNTEWGMMTGKRHHGFKMPQNLLR